MMKPIGHHDPTHLTEPVERRAHLRGGRARTMNPERTAREPNDCRSRSQANTAEPHRTFGDPDGIGHDDFENAGSCHGGNLSGTRRRVRRKQQKHAGNPLAYRRVRDKAVSADVAS